LADPGTRESLRVPLQDELDHVAFGLSELHKALADMDPQLRKTRLEKIPVRIQGFVNFLQRLDVPVVDWFEQVGAGSQQLCAVLSQRKDELLSELAA
jgi:hypothetical protein